MNTPSRHRTAGTLFRRRSQQNTLLREIASRTRTAHFQKYVRQLLVELCRIDTTPKPDPRLMREAEHRCFGVLERELGALNFANSHLERRLINPEIKNHPNYSLLHFTKTARRPRGLSPKETYAGRSNLLYVLDGSGHAPGGKSVALDAHIDVVAPYIPPRVSGGTVFGRGACDDKGPVVSIVAALRVLSKIMEEQGLGWNRNVTAMFVVEEETGGNGSLSLAMDPDLKKLYDSVIVCECTDLNVHPANRGAVWYKAALKSLRDVSPLEVFAFVNEEMENEGRAIRAESHHELFPQRPVQTCHGIIGPFGEHPSRICGEVSFIVEFARRPDEKTLRLVRDCLDAGLAQYIGLYGDKTKLKDPATGKPMVARHFDVLVSGRNIRVDVHGATGHMGAIRERDGAITKMAHLIRSLVSSKKKLEQSAECPVSLDLASPKGDKKIHFSGLVFEGGQGFVPTHSLAEVMQRLQQAAQRGAENYLRRIGRDKHDTNLVTITYEKLHNDSFAGDPRSASMRNAVAAAQHCGLWKNEPVLGWTVSCDARLFASEYPDMDVLTFGPGRLIYAHSDQEQIQLEEIRAAAEFLAIFLLRQTGTLSS